MIDYSRHLPANPHRETGDPISETSPDMLKVNTQFYMETDGKRMFTVKTLKFKLYLYHITLTSVLFSLTLVASSCFRKSEMQIVSFYCLNGPFVAKRLNHVFGNKFKYTNILETQFPSYMYHKFPNCLMIYNITIL